MEFENQSETGADSNAVAQTLIHATLIPKANQECFLGLALNDPAQPVRSCSPQFGI